MCLQQCAFISYYMYMYLTDSLLIKIENFREIYKKLLLLSYDNFYIH